MMWIDQLNNQRHHVSSVVSLCVVAVIWLMTQSIVPLQRSVSEEPMELSLLSPEPIRPVIQPPPMPVRPVKPLMKSPQPAPVTPVMAALPTASAAPSAPASTNEPAKIEVPRPIQATPVAPSQPVAEPVKPPPPPSSANIETAYVSSVRALLNANKRYPTGREASLQRPSGKAVVWFVLNRHGSLQEAGIEDSSNSIILDNAALSTVRRTSYTPWPEGSWPGQNQHRFTVTLDFVPLN